MADRIYAAIRQGRKTVNFPTRSLSARAGWLFYAVNLALWLGYAFTQYFGSRLVGPPPGLPGLPGLTPVLAVAATFGFAITGALRQLYRRLWDRGPRDIIIGTMFCSYVVALMYRAVVNSSSQIFIDPNWPVSTVPELFVGALGTTYMMLCWSAFYFGIKYYERERLQRESELRALALANEAQLNLLRFKLNPHYLFNTLNCVSTLILDDDLSTANQALTSLSRLLRYTLDQDPMKKVALREEISTLELYLYAERLRLGSRLRVEYSVDEETLEALVPSLLLQPAVEIVIAHAIALREEGGTISIESRIAAAMLRVCIASDARRRGVSYELTSKSNSVLQEMRDRLNKMYGDFQRISMDENDLGVRIEIAFPFEPANKRKSCNDSVTARRGPY